MNNEPHRTPEAPGGRERALVEKAWRQAEQAWRAEQEADSAAGLPGGTVLAGPPPDSFTGYKIVRELHRGGQGVVYQAIQEATQRKVAIKVMREGPFAGAADRARFDREVHVLGQLNHPHIVAIHDTGSAAGHHYFVTDYIPGQPLDVYMAGADHTVDETLRLFGQICEAVNAAHLRGVIHRDLKPGNIRIDPDGEPHILDFGLAKVAVPTGPETGPTAMTLTGQFVGSLPWASPEQAEGQPAKIDVRTDVYSLGVILYQMLTGRFPYQVIGNMRNVLDNILTADPARPSTLGVAAGLRAGRLNDEIDTIVLKCLHKERERRYQTAGEVARDIGHYLSGEPIEAKRDSAGYVLRKHLVKYKLPVAAAAGFLVVITAGLLTSLVLWRQASVERDRASEALKLAEQRQQETQQVADFQSSMLAKTDAEGMGLAIVDGFEQRIRAALAKGIEDQGELDRVMHAWRQQTLKAGPTNVALEVLDDFVLAKAARTIEKDFADQPLVRAALQHTVAVAYREFGLHESAVPLLAAALQTRRDALGDDHVDTLDSINSMGVLLESMGKYEEALRYHQEGLEGHRRVLGNDHPYTLAVISNMGVLLQSMGKYAEAERYYRETLEGRRRVLGDDDPDTLSSMDKMGVLLMRMGRHAQAEPYQREALEGRRRLLGDDHPSTLNSIGNMGVLLRQKGRYEEAEPYYRAAMEGCRRVLGDDHPHTLTSINNMGSLLQKQGKLTEAEPFFREALEGFRRVLGDAHPDTLTLIKNVGALFQDMGRYAEAEVYCREALAGFRRVLGDDHPRTLGSIHNMGSLLREMGKPAEAEPWCREALAGFRRVLGDDHPSTLICINTVGALLRKLGRLEEAEALGAEAVRGARAKLAPTDAVLLTMLAEHGCTLATMQRFVEAETELLEAYEGFAKIGGAKDRQTIAVTRSLMELYDGWHESEPGQGHVSARPRTG